ncbi:MAG TPA: hypothetical protein VL598_04260 [Trinickia sp.]|jgi:hypothetical protein|uniref:hypothetical protein n=1 Tax=Trinickia sp. TaxID=2571163 RepID=UPI002C9703FF|nr:hypothetical protein [Trinickia sp.]HTI16856.1 hypothetical protein [Trinickia sp.]
MANPKIGIVGALVAVGGVMAWRWAQKRRASQARFMSELTRWEGEGGALASVAQAAPAADHDAWRGSVPHVGGTLHEWVFPHSGPTTEPTEPQRAPVNAPSRLERRAQAK